MNTVEQAVKRRMVNATMVVEAWDADVGWNTAAQAAKQTSVVRRKGITVQFSCARHRPDSLQKMWCRPELVRV